MRPLAQTFGPAVINRLAFLALKGKSELAQIAAAWELLDRGYGRAVQNLQTLDGFGNPTDAPMRVIIEFVGDAAPIRPEHETRQATACRATSTSTFNW